MRSERGWEALLENREGFGVPPVGPGGFGRPSRRDGRGWEALSEVWKTFPEVQELKSPPGSSRGVGRPSLKSGRCWEVLLEDWKRWGAPTGGPGRFGRFSWKSRRGQEESGGPPVGSGGPPVGSGGIRRPSCRVRRDREALLEVRDILPEVQEGSGGPSGEPGGVGRPCRRFGKVGRLSLQPGRGVEALLACQEGSGGPL